MAIEVPELDDIDHERLLDEARSLLEATDDGWDDHGAHDPGVTVVELLAWLTESYGYQLDAVTDDHRDAFLALLGTPPRPPSRARAWLALSTPEPVTIPAGTQLRADDGSDAGEPFETERSVPLTDAEVKRVLTESDGAVTDNSHADATHGLYYRAFGDEPTVGDALCLAFDRDPFGGNDTLALTVRFHEENLSEPADPDQRSQLIPSTEVCWEYCLDADREEWQPLPVVRDGTTRLYETGTVTLGRPGGWPEDGSNGGGSASWWVRCRVTEPGWEVPPQFDAVETNLVAVRHGRSVETERLERAAGSSLALDGQRFEFPRTPVQSATVSVDGSVFEQVRTFDRSGPNDAHCVLDGATGAVTFGGGRKGEAPAAGATVVARDVRYGGGTVGDVPSDAAWQFEPGETIPGSVSIEEVGVSPRTAATGGRDAESVEAAFDRVRDELQRPARAVTRADVERLAADTPGLRVDRTAVVEDDQPGITVVVVPEIPPDCRRPRASDGFLDAVRRHLDEHRLLTDRLTVRGPSHVTLDVRATVVPIGTDAEVDRAAAAIAAIERSLSEWPVGRGLATSTLREWIADADEVQTVTDVDVSVRGDGAVETDGWVAVGPGALLAVGDVTLSESRPPVQNGGRS